MITSEQELTGVLNNEIIETGGGKYAPRYVIFRDYKGTELNEEITNLDTSNVTSMGYMFNNCNYLESLDLTSFDTSNVTDMNNMFYKCYNLTSLDLSNFDTSKVTNMQDMFSTCTNLKTLNVDNFNTANVTNMIGMFRYCDYIPSLDLSSFDTSNVTTMSGMFYRDYDLAHVDLSNFDTSKVTSMRNMFWGFLKLAELDMSNFDMCSVKDIYGMLYAGNSNKTLQDLSFGTNLGMAFINTSNNYEDYTLDLSTLHGLSHDSLMSVINNLYDLNLTYNVANGGTLYTQKLLLGSTNLAKLTADEIAIATAKGWNVS